MPPRRSRGDHAPEERDRRHQGSTGGIGAAFAPSGRLRARRRAARRPPVSKPSTRDRTCRSVRIEETLENDIDAGAARARIAARGAATARATVRHVGWQEQVEASRAPLHLAQDPAQPTLEVTGQLRVSALCCRRVGTHHDERPRRKYIEAVTREVTKPPLHAITHHCSPDRTRYDEAHPRGVSCTRLRQVDDDRRLSCTAALAHGGLKVAATAHPVRGRKHPADRWQGRFRPRARRGPCADAQR